MNGNQEDINQDLHVVVIIRAVLMDEKVVAAPIAEVIKDVVLAVEAVEALTLTIRRVAVVVHLFLRLIAVVGADNTQAEDHTMEAVEDIKVVDDHMEVEVMVDAFMVVVVIRNAGTTDTIKIIFTLMKEQKKNIMNMKSNGKKNQLHQPNGFLHDDDKKNDNMKNL